MTQLAVTTEENRKLAAKLELFKASFVSPKVAPEYLNEGVDVGARRRIGTFEQINGLEASWEGSKQAEKTPGSVAAENEGLKASNAILTRVTVTEARVKDLERQLAEAVKDKNCLFRECNVLRTSLDSKEKLAAAGRETTDKRVSPCSTERASLTLLSVQPSPPAFKFPSRTRNRWSRSGERGSSSIPKYGGKCRCTPWIH